MEAVRAIRRKSGPQSGKKGKKGCNRKKFKQATKEYRLLFCFKK